jgi:hypothetical protein
MSEKRNANKGSSTVPGATHPRRRVMSAINCKRYGDLQQAQLDRAENALTNEAPTLLACTVSAATCSPATPDSTDVRPSVACFLHSNESKLCQAF